MRYIFTGVRERERERESTSDENYNKNLLRISWLNLGLLIKSFTQEKVEVSSRRQMKILQGSKF